MIDTIGLSKIVFCKNAKAVKNYRYLWSREVEHSKIKFIFWGEIYSGNSIYSSIFENILSLATPSLFHTHKLVLYAMNAFDNRTKRRKKNISSSYSEKYVLEKSAQFFIFCDTFIVSTKDFHYAQLLKVNLYVKF